MEVTGHDPYICEIANKGVRYDGNRGRLYKIPDGATGIYCKSFDGSITTNLVTFYDETKVSLNFFSLPVDGERYVGIPSEARYISIRIGKSDGVAGQTYKDRIMVSFSPIKEWIPPFYSEMAAKLTLRSLPDGTCDEYLGDGKILRRVAHVVINGTETIGYSTSGKRFEVKGFPNQAQTNRTNAFCNRLDPDESPIAGFNKDNTICGYQRNETVYIIMRQFENVGDFKNWIINHPIVYEYQLAEPVIETIDPILIETKAPYGYCTNDSKIDTEIEYEILANCDYTAEIIDIKKRLASLEKAVLE